MTDGLLGALVAGGTSLLLFFLSNRRTRGQWRDAWQQQATQLRNELKKVYEQQIVYLQGQVAALQQENGRLQRLLSRRNRGTTDD